MYIAEAIPTMLIGIVTLFVLTDRPEQAKFLTAAEKDLAGQPHCCPSARRRKR